MKNLMSGFFAVTIAASLLSAMEAQPAAAADNCADLSNQGAMNECYGKALMAEDKELNATYREIEKRLADDADTRKLLVAAERAWIAYRDAECTFSASRSVGGSIYSTLIATCKAALTAQRNKDLKVYLRCEEGDMSCPVPASR